MAKPAFDHCSGAYARYRPAYPEPVFDLIEEITGPTAPRRAADVGAGTGIFTRQLARHGWDVVAVEPSMQMLTQPAPDDASGPQGRIWRVRGAAEATAVRDGSMGLVTCAQSFHWFNPPVALREFARILRPRSPILLAWNNRQASDAFVSRFEQLIHRWNPTYHREYRRQDWAVKVAEVGLFCPLDLRNVEWVWRISQDAFVGFTQSVSYVRNVLSASDRSAFERDLRGLLEVHFRHDDVIVPMRTEVWWRTGTPRPERVQ